MPQHAGRIAVAAAIALVAFASNSIFCRLALGSRHIDPSSFTTVRIVSGAAVLIALAVVSRARRPRERTRAGWTSGAYLFAYAIAFSLSYTMLGAGTGALILFPAVQMTMLLAALRAGERPRRLEWLGLSLALAGLVYLVMPGLEAPSPVGALLMAAAGGAWGLYSLRGRGSPDPLGDTARNFMCAVPFALVASAASMSHAHASSTGLALATVSGAISSGLGYVIWYAALRGLSATRAATVQLAVPVIAAVGGIVFLHETLTTRLVIAGTLILGGVGMALAGRGR
ncbi:MAG TPA: DMT family transporter [Candidatus Krumholzibacteria bacterium]|nr:DMT family transporter [Candidatus Krumholzibacteria bacterium]